MSGMLGPVNEAINFSPRSALEDVFVEEPVALDVFIKDQKFLGSEWSLSPIQTDLVQHMEKVYLPSLYPLMAEEWGGYWDLTLNIPMKNYLSAEWGKGCVSGDTEVYDPITGMWRRIDDIDASHMVAGTHQVSYSYGIGDQVEGDTSHKHGEPYNNHHDVVSKATASKPFIRGHGKMLRVTTRTGSSIDVYEGHLFGAKRGVNYDAEWTAAGALKPGNLIVVPRKLPQPTKPYPLSHQNIQFAVSLITDGTLPTGVDRAYPEQVATFLQEVKDVRFPTLKAARWVKRLYLRTGVVATVAKSGKGWKVIGEDLKRIQGEVPSTYVAWDMVDTIEDIGEADYWDMNVPDLGTYVANGFINSNSGKDHTVRIAVLRIAYLLLCLKSPQKYFGMPEQDSIHMLNVAANAPQAHRAFFKPLTQAVKRGWFADHADPHRDTIQFDKNIEAVSGHSDAEAQEGLNLKVAVADEIDAFKTKAELVGHGNKAREASTTAESILEMMESSASTRFPHTFKRVAISYPRYQGSMIQKETRKGHEDNKKYTDSVYFASGPYATWEVNPLRKRSDFDKKYRENPVEAAAKYECKPFRASAPYFRQPEIFTQAITEEHQPVSVDYALRKRVSEKTGLETESWEAVFHFDPDFKARQGAAYAIHADLAIKGDRAGISMSHVEELKSFTVFMEDEEGNMLPGEEVRPVIRNDFTIALSADVGAAPAREIQIRWVRELVFKLIADGFHIASVTYDGYQSTDSMQILESHGIETDRVSTDRDMSIWKTLKDVASDGRLKMPHEQLLLDELEGLSEVNGKVDHPPAGSKDLADAFACSIVGAIIAGGEESEDRSIVSSEESIFEIGIFHDLPLGLSGGGHQMPLVMRDY